MTAWAPVVLGCWHLECNIFLSGLVPGLSPWLPSLIVVRQAFLLTLRYTIVFLFTLWPQKLCTDEPALVTGLWGCWKFWAEIPAKPNNCISWGGVNRGRAECSWALASMELSLNSPPEALCKKAFISKYETALSVLLVGCWGCEIPSGHSKAHLTATPKLYSLFPQMISQSSEKVVEDNQHSG